MDTHLATQIILLLILLLASAFFSSAETALTTVNRIQIQLLADEGNKNAVKVLKILDHAPKMLSAILIGNNLVNISASALATTLTIHVFGNAAVGIATGILTLLVLVFGEITPKSLAAVLSIKLALAYANFIWFLMLLLTPVIFILEGVRTGLLLLIGIDPNKKLDVMTEDELKTLVDVAHEDSAIENDEFEMISNVFRLDDSLAKDIMVPRIDMVYVQADATYEELMETFREHNYTRYPVYNDSKDTVIGTINVKDLLIQPLTDFSIRNILREPHFTFEHKEIGTLLLEMKKDHLSLVIVLDEYGSTAGMITLEDVLEEIVGEIRDEYDFDEKDDILELKKGKEFLINGSTNLDDVNEATGLSLESEEYDSIGGFLIETLDRLPKSGEHLRLTDGTELIAEVVKRNRVEKVHLIMKK